MCKQPNLLIGSVLFLAIVAGSQAAVQFPTGTPRGGSRVSTQFGQQTPAGKGHLGTDFDVPENTPVYAIDDGTVTFSGWAGAGWGNVIIVSHPSGICSLYGHVKLGAAKGTQVLRGSQIAAVGPKAATSTAAHLHLECRKGPDAATKPGPAYAGQNFDRTKNPTWTVRGFNMT